MFTISKFPISRFHFSGSDCIFIHFDFFISCDIALELSCVVYHSVHFVSNYVNARYEPVTSGLPVYEDYILTQN
jgi:hypothetical protein